MYHGYATTVVFFILKTKIFYKPFLKYLTLLQPSTCEHLTAIEDLQNITNMTERVLQTWPWVKYLPIDN